jgi:hypothetical protein
LSTSTASSLRSPSLHQSAWVISEPVVSKA